MKDDLSRSLMELRGRVTDACQKYDRDTDDITIVAVTKTFPASAIRRAVAVGLHAIGESRIQEAEPKIAEVGPIASFHLVGHLQSNKAKKAVQLFDVIQSIDSLKLAEEISRHAAAEERTIECYLQVNCSGEEHKFGASEAESLELVEQIRHLSNIELTGLMTVGPLTDDEAKIRASFARCRELYVRAREIVGDSFDTLSMGMSDDFPLAIAEGSNMIRVGSALFGPRDPA